MKIPQKFEMQEMERASAFSIPSGPNLADTELIQGEQSETIPDRSDEKQ